MARNEQLIRQHKLLQVLERSRFGKTLEEVRDDLVEELGLTSLHTRSVRRDIEALQAAGFHLDSEQLGSMAYDAILRNLAVIGEAVKALPEELKSERSEVPWASIAGLRNVVVHEYFRVDPEMIRDIVDHQPVVLVQRVEGSP